jgi:hypothetical protein
MLVFQNQQNKANFTLENLILLTCIFEDIALNIFPLSQNKTWEYISITNLTITNTTFTNGGFSVQSPKSTVSVLNLEVQNTIWTK